MLKIVKSFALVAAVAAIAGVGTYSYFTDSVSVNGNKITAGDLEVEVDGYGSTTLPFDLQNWYPGQSEDVEIKISNTGSLPIFVEGGISGIWNAGLGDHHVTATVTDYSTGSGWMPFDSAKFGEAGVRLPGGARYLEEVASGDALYLRFNVEFDGAAGNEYENRIYTASFEVDAYQPNDSYIVR